MEVTFNKTRVLLKQGDITQETVDAIVNAANSGLLGGGGVDGAIHRAGGSEILEECKKIRQRKGHCPPGGAVITTAGRLHADYVIHTVGPVWHGGQDDEESVLRNAYRNSLRLAKEHGAHSIAFPSISTGAYGFPIEKAAPVALAAIKEFAATETSLQEVRFILFSQGDLRVYEEALKTLAS